MIQAAEKLGKQVGVAAACRALGVPRSSLYRARHAKPVAKPRPTPERALSQAEKWLRLAWYTTEVSGIVASTLTISRMSEARAILGLQHKGAK